VALYLGAAAKNAVTLRLGEQHRAESRTAPHSAGGRGYTVGYQRVSGNLPAAPPACPVQLSSHRRESGYL